MSNIRRGIAIRLYRHAVTVTMNDTGG